MNSFRAWFVFIAVFPRRAFFSGTLIGSSRLARLKHVQEIVFGFL